MAASGFFALLDDIATLLDDVLVMSKLAAKKTSGVLGDDLALNAQQVAGVHAERELPVVWAVAKGSLRNKLILVPAALLISAFAPWLIAPLLILGGGYLCFEGVEKIFHSLLHPAAEQSHKQALQAALDDPHIDLVAFERDKIKGAITTDFVLSAEIIVITLGTVAGASFAHQCLVVSLIALLMTLGVYGLVALIVKLDDIGLHLCQTPGRGWPALRHAMGRGLLVAAPALMKTLSVVGTIAMFLVGGGILVHNLAPLHHLSESLSQYLQTWPLAGFCQAVATNLFAALAGIGIGALVVAGVTGLGWVRQMFKRGS